MIHSISRVFGMDYFKIFCHTVLWWRKQRWRILRTPCIILSRHLTVGWLHQVGRYLTMAGQNQVDLISRDYWHLFWNYVSHYFKSFKLYCQKLSENKLTWFRPIVRRHQLRRHLTVWSYLTQEFLTEVKSHFLKL